ncbi:hypothetical protein Cs7R123_14330 [Catellatospora sp. TT07R-123]|uniref:methyltransferase domain-containing protein n=1 Tax=Catellatospora sp. TT07R-123 TaxID=2733863 RepID=UPI001B07C475|nr:methyltransferase domain-containing protein [Catellatospora sp. TT07R-123]GHJ44091.1 hypothetical protein Cs7R123_14330 [Catellatospora sp. TT07R-123]
MTSEATPQLSAAQQRRWDELLAVLVDAVGPGPRAVVVDGGGHSAWFADRLGAALHGAGRDCARLTDAAPHHDEDAWYALRGPHTVALADGPRWRAAAPAGRWDVLIWLRTPGPRAEHPHDAHVVVDLHDPGWPVLRHLDDALADRERWYLPETRAFFAVRAATWDTRFGDDAPAYALAVAELGPAPGSVVADIGCGSGRALPPLRAAVGPDGTVLGLDVTEQMLDAARGLGRAGYAHLLLADARRLPLRDGGLDAIFAAGLVNHLPDTRAGLAELARVTRPGGRLALFHPSGRAALAARHGRALRPDEPLAEGPLRTHLHDGGWTLDAYDDADHRFLALATRD